MSACFSPLSSARGKVAAVAVKAASTPPILKPWRVTDSAGGSGVAARPAGTAKATSVSNARCRIRRIVTVGLFRATFTVMACWSQAVGDEVILPVAKPVTEPNRTAIQHLTAFQG